MGIKEIREILAAVAVLVASAKKVMADGKVDLKDLPAVVELLMKVDQIMKAVEGANLVVAEAKDLDSAEIAIVLADIKAIVDAVKVKAA